MIEPKNCRACGKQFTKDDLDKNLSRPMSITEWYRKYYCSPKCGRKAQNKANRWATGARA